LATWPDKCDYYIIQLGGGEWRLQIGDFIDHAYPMSAMKLFVEGEALLVLGYFGRFEFFQDIQARQLPDGVTHSDCSAFYFQAPFCQTTSQSRSKIKRPRNGPLIWSEPSTLLPSPLSFDRGRNILL
jgi:hypothetical protein